MTADEFEGLNEQRAEARIAERFRALSLNGLPPGLSLIFAVHPEIDIDAPSEMVGDASLGTAA